MRVLGGKASLQTFRWDLIYLLGQLSSDKRPDITALAASVQSKLAEIKAERDALEQAEDQDILATGLMNKRDRARDELVIAAGGVARAQDKGLYQTLFGKLSPTATARLGFDAESKEVARILGELGKLPVDHPIRTTYEAALGTAESELKTAQGQTDTAETDLALQRSHAFRFKLDLDKLRVELHGKLVALLKDKEEASSFFRPTTLSPEDKPDKANPDAPPPPPPA